MAKSALIVQIICKQCSLHVKISTMNSHNTLKRGCTFIGITIQLCPSSNLPNHHYYWTPGDCTCMHAVKKGRRLENEKFFELKSGGYRDGIKGKETR